MTWKEEAKRVGQCLNEALEENRRLRQELEAAKTEIERLSRLNIRLGQERDRAWSEVDRVWGDLQELTEN